MPPTAVATTLHDDSVAIRIRGVGRTFGARDALVDISFESTRGSLTGIVGPDAAGKTTLLRVLASILPPTSGDAWIDGRSVRDEAERVKDRIGYMSQRFGLYTDLSVRENIDFYADLYLVPTAERDARIEQLYAFSGLRPFSARLAGALSGGMRQKLGLCCALIHQPSVLLLDEPTFGVDPLSRHELWRFIEQMIARGVTVLLSTAYLEEAERCDRVGLLNDGRLLAFDTPDVLRASGVRTGAPFPTLEDAFIARVRHG